MKIEDRFIRFLEEYAEYFLKMAEDEREKLDALLSYELKRIEQVISVQQASCMRIANLEKRRMELQKEVGLDGMTFQEIIAVSDESDREVLRPLFEQIETAVHDVKYYNGEAMELVKLNLRAIHATVPEMQPGGYSSDKSQTAAFAPGTPSIFETKI